MHFKEGRSFLSAVQPSITAIGLNFLLILLEELKLRDYRVARSLLLPFITKFDMQSSLVNHFIHKLVVLD